VGSIPIIRSRKSLHQTMEALLSPASEGSVIMPKRCIIISGGEFSPIKGLSPDDYRIACDKGYVYAKRCGIVPDMVVSDFDSYSGPIDENIPVNRFQSEKDDTDTMIAVRYAVSHGFEEIRLLCALGGRLDHTLANLQALVFAQEHGVRASLEAADTRIYTLQNGAMQLPRRDGWSLSVFAAKDRCTGVNICGVKYPLRDALVTNSFPIGVSNEWAAESAQVSVKSGILLIVLSRL